jgi:hypothetical protein
VVEPGAIGPFLPQDGFLRRTDRPNRIKGGLVFWEAFKPRMPHDTDGLSFTYQNHQLQNEDSLRQFQVDHELKLGDLPGVCRITFGDLTECLQPPLPPRSKADPDDKRYGGLHCLTDLPVSQEHMESMANLASGHNEFGLPFPLVDKKKRARSAGVKPPPATGL